jgi:hypothetical protein
MNPTEWGALAALGAFLGVSASLEIGYRLARQGRHEGAGSLEAAVFALLGLLLGFSFAGASTRLDKRRELIVQEANAIGTAYLRLDLLPPEPKTEMRRMLRDYLDQRLRIFADFPDISAAERDNKIATEMQRKIWELAARSTEPESMRTAALLLLPALNEAFDTAATRTALLYAHIPALILGLLVVVSLLSGLLAGYGMAKRGTRGWLHGIVYALTLAATIYVVVDLDYPRFGFIRVDASDNALIQLRQTLEAR